DRLFVVGGRRFHLRQLLTGGWRRTQCPPALAHGGSARDYPVQRLSPGKYAARADRRVRTFRLERLRPRWTPASTGSDGRENRCFFSVIPAKAGIHVFRPTLAASRTKPNVGARPAS